MNSIVVSKAEGDGSRKALTLLVPDTPPTPEISLEARAKALTTMSCVLKDRRRRVPNSLTLHPASIRVFAFWYANSDE